LAHRKDDEPKSRALFVFGIILESIRATTVKRSVTSLPKATLPFAFNVPAKVVAPVPTLKVLVPVIEVLPFKETAPEPVPKVPVPVWLKLPEAIETPVNPVKLPAVKVAVLSVKEAKVPTPACVIFH